MNQKFVATLVLSAGVHFAVFLLAPVISYESQKSSYSIDIYTYQVTSELKQYVAPEKSANKTVPKTKSLRDLSLKNSADKKPSLSEPSEENKEIESISQTPSNFTSAPQLLFKVIPKLPLHFQNENLKTSVIIEFAVDEAGESKPQLIESSENQELDQLAYQAAAQWQFKAATKNGAAAPSKVRLRINFLVK